MPYQQGLAQAVASVLGHEPGACTACAPPPCEREAQRALLTIIGAQDGNRWERVLTLARLATIPVHE